MVCPHSYCFFFLQAGYYPFVLNDGGQDLLFLVVLWLRSYAEVVSAGFVKILISIFYLYCINVSFSTLKCFKNCTIPRRSCLVGGYSFLLVDYVLNHLMLLDISSWDLSNICFINCIFLAGGLV